MYNRKEWVDYAKGIAIFLVILAHIINGYIIVTGMPHGHWIIRLMRTAYTVSLSGFFLFSGLFAVKLHEKEVVSVFMNKVRTILYPYVIWVLTFGIFKIYFSSNVVVNISLGDLPYIFIYPIGVSWFLYALFWMFIIYKMLSIKLNIVIILFISVIMHQLPPYTDLVIVRRILHYFIFFVLGATSSVWILKKQSEKYFRLWIAIPVFLLMICAHIFSENIEFPKFAKALSGSYFIISLSLSLANGKLLPIVSYIGKISLMVYLIHMFPVTALRVVLLNYLHITNVYLYIVIQMVLTTLSCLLFIKILEKFKMRQYLFGR